MKKKPSKNNPKRMSKLRNNPFKKRCETKKKNVTFRAIAPQAQGEWGAQQTQQKSTRNTHLLHTNPTMSEEGE